MFDQGKTRVRSGLDLGGLGWNFGRSWVVYPRRGESIDCPVELFGEVLEPSWAQTWVPGSYLVPRTGRAEEQGGGRKVTEENLTTSTLTVGNYET